ncbi:helix-turn-helix domain-containing protein [Salinicoccus hispanicus]|uniref:Helix-turn-helix domain-containing protein n=1 Tax=Salinicoccus hispanicus TaxID=157225 RepID=A0A6N8U3E8_9STAP|nr:helix-turn-helix transcriptional regulator [Salinicoccus hispanicus]MXQ51576.1 helix-turn-helix domain-containing protein [Salinicoccus hispanicus]
MENVGEKIRGRRKMMAFSQLKLAENITSQSAISRLENDIYTIPLNELIDVLERLNLSIHDVFCGNYMTPFHIIQQELDECRVHGNYIRMEEIIESECDQFWRQSPELEGYHQWHLAIVEYSKGNLKEALSKINEAIAENDTNEWMYEKVAEMYLAKGNILSKMNIDAVEFYKEAESYYAHSGKKSFKLIVKVLFNLSISYCKRHEYGRAMKYADKAKKILQEKESTYLLCEILYNEVVSLNALGYSDEALKIIKKSEYLYKLGNKLELYEKLKNYSRENISS